MGKIRRVSHSELEHLRGINRALKSEIKALKSELASLTREKPRISSGLECKQCFVDMKLALEAHGKQYWCCVQCGERITIKLEL